MCYISTIRERGEERVIMSHLDFKINPDASHMCVGIKSHTYDDSMYNIQCHRLYYNNKMCLQNN
jgi:hypothetical protein